MLKYFVRLKIKEEEILIYSEEVTFKENLELLKEVIEEDIYADNARFNWDEYPMHLSDAIACFSGYEENGNLYSFGDRKLLFSNFTLIQLKDTLVIPSSDIGAVEIDIDYIKDSEQI